MSGQRECRLTACRLGAVTASASASPSTARPPIIHQKSRISSAPLSPAAASRRACSWFPSNASAMPAMHEHPATT